MFALQQLSLHGGFE